MEILTANNISHDKVLEITKFSFPKGTTTIIPNSSRALGLLSHVPRTQVACSRAWPERPFDLVQPARRGRGIAKNPRKPKILQRGPEDQPDPNAYALSLSGSSKEPVARPTNQQQHQQQMHPASPYPITLNVSNEELKELNVQLLLRDGVIVSGNQMVQLQLDDIMLLQ
ncbi:uncharacterized protein LOC113234277 [Hyposmocoma kahamanoa]|uniref:uncharacterized protein LOC113234277 n=1 Tax=Hyposmocoma kahamanoa TaxID=1477025 RepID=UPI000E6D7270|nr:uncharacterized protein LOC113234277 [Hyposmocoma kahamanoa]